MIIVMRLPVTRSRRCEQITAFGESDVPDVKINAQIESTSGSRPGSAAPVWDANASSSGSPSVAGGSPGATNLVDERIGGSCPAIGREERFVARLGDHEPAMRVHDVAQQVLAATGVVEPDDGGADQGGASEREEIVGRVVEEHRDVAGAGPGRSSSNSRGEPARLVEVLARASIADRRT